MKETLKIRVNRKEKEDNINFFCPICGLPNKINTFFVPEVLKKVQQKAMNYMLEELEQTLGKSIKKINKSGFIKMSMKSSKKEAEKERREIIQNMLKESFTKEQIKKVLKATDTEIARVEKEMLVK